MSFDPSKDYHDALIRVRYAETDQMGVVYHANYLIWFEVGRVELMRALGFEYKLMETEDDCFIVVVEASCRYHHPARYDELLRVRTRIAHTANRMIKYSYELLRHSDDHLIATGATTHVICGKDGKPKKLPQKYQDKFRELATTPLEQSFSTVQNESA
ncbi:MAG TPA: thioesterase family protein [Candidatus Acidoferrum sp.]